MIRHRGLLVALPVGLLLFWAPWRFGSVTPLAAAFLEAGFAAAFAVAALAAPSLARARTVALPAAALLLLALLGLAQSLSWPPAVAAAVSPEHLRLRAESAAALRGEEELSEPLEGVALSLAPEVSRRTSWELAALALALVAAAVAGGVRPGRRIVTGAILAAAVGQVLYGAPRWLSGATTLFGVEVHDSGRLRGTFINPNHLAEYLEIALAIAFAWGWWAVYQAGKRGRRLESRIASVAAPLLLWLTLLAALAFTGSRAGLLAAIGGTFVQTLLVVATRPGGRWLRRLALAGAGAVVLAAGVGLVALIGGHQGVGRLTATSAYEVAGNLRFEVARAAVDLWSRFPLLGTGLGTFLDAFPLVQPEHVPLTWRHAHDDPVELLVTTGVVGAGLFLAGLGALLGRLTRVLNRGVRSEDRAMAVAALGALAALALHETVDFGLTLPAVSFTLVALVGSAAAAPRSPRRPDLPSAAPARSRGLLERFLPRAPGVDPQGLEDDTRG